MYDTISWFESGTYFLGLGDDGLEHIILNEELTDDGTHD